MKLAHHFLSLSFSLVIPLALKADISRDKQLVVPEAMREQTSNDNLMIYLLTGVLVLTVLIAAYLLWRLKHLRAQNEFVREHQLQLQERERKYHEVFNYSLDSIITTDPNGIITDLNESAKLMLGYPNNELIGQNVRILFASEDQATKVIDELSKADRFVGEILNRTKDGKILIIRLSANQVRNSKDEVVGTIVISRDITEKSMLRDEHNKLIHNVSDIIYTANLHGDFININQPVETILGYSVEEVTTKSFKDFIHEDHLEMVTEHYSNVFKERMKESYLEFKIIAKGGKEVWVGQHVNTKFNAQDNSRVDGYYGILRVIDKRKKAELKLQGSEKKYRDLINNSAELVQIIDQTGKFLYVNRAWEETMKYSKKDIETLKVFDLIHPESKDHCMKLFNLIGQHAVIDSKRILYSLVAKDGEKIIVEGSFSAKYDNDANIFSIQSFLRNVTLQKEAEHQLEQKERTLRQITETITDVFYLYNIVEQKYEYISPNCEETLGANAQFFYDGRSHTTEFGHPEDIDVLKGAKSDVYQGFSYDINFRIIVKGEVRWINEKSFAICDEAGNIVANSGICRDVTEIRQANETIRLQNLEIGSSILYAKRIQDAVLPSRTEINRVFPDSFVIFKPKDVVSGDFYIVENIKTIDNFEMPAFIVGDCTGHGVPGAVLSLMCNVLVRESFTRHDVNSPAGALEYVRIRLTDFFSNTDERNIRDGMDIAFCAVNDQNNQLYFSGANSKCILIRDGELTVFRGNRQHVGYDENPSPFEDHTIDFLPGDRFFLYSDGLTDQFGGDNGKKFGKTQLHALLRTNLPMNKLGALIAAELEDWQGDSEQVDDITLLGVQL